MLKTYTLYLRGEGAPAFEPVMCANHAELIAHARQLLHRHSDCTSVDVFFGDAELFRVRQEEEKP